MTLESPFVTALNHVLGAEQWARDRLVPFSGERIEFALPPLPALKFEILDDGRLAAAPRDATASLVLRLRADAVAGLLRGEEVFLRSVEVTGNARLASEVLVLVRHLRWDAEEDLSQLVGDVVAHRVMGAARDILGWQRDALQRTAQAAIEYTVEERRTVLARTEFESFSSDVARLRDGVDRLEQRLRRLA